METLGTEAYGAAIAAKLQAPYSRLARERSKGRIGQMNQK